MSKIARAASALFRKVKPKRTASGSTSVNNIPQMPVMADVDSALASTDTNAEHDITMLQERFKCPHFRILVIGRANAGKTTILEKVCGVEKGTKPIIYDKNGLQLEPTEIHLIPSIDRGIHDIEHQITFQGSNFIFHDSQGFEAGAIEELNAVWAFIEKLSAKIEMRDQLHAIWYCVPMDSPRPVLPAELEFFNKGTGNVPLVVVFTKFDGQIVQEYGKLHDIHNDEDKWNMARKKAENTFQTAYLAKFLNTEHPPKAYVQLEDMDLSGNACPELTETTAEAIDDDGLYQLFVSTQMNNVNLCVHAALQHVLAHQGESEWPHIFVIIARKFPHYWVDRGVISFVMEYDNIR
ncbi:hypothetical protein AX14_002110 [Amanita brunnescens Koide BX004]|nr:hypothetical protein AX14_002110 [Amanita brunnescens Koide BX004]